MARPVVLVAIVLRDALPVVWLDAVAKVPTVPILAVTLPPLFCMGVPSVVLIVVRAVLPVVCKAEVDAHVGREMVPDMFVRFQVPLCELRVRSWPEPLTIA